MLDAAAFPHLLDAILAHAGADALEAFRATSRAFRDRVDALLDSRLQKVVVLDSSPSEPGVVVGRNHAGEYAGIRTPVTRAVLARCAVVRILEINTSDPAVASITSHMRPRCLGIEGYPDRVDAIPISAEAVAMHYLPGECPFTVNTRFLLIVYHPLPAIDEPSIADSPPEGCRPLACTAVVNWIPPARVEELYLSFMRLSELPEAHAGQLLHAVARQLMSGARVTFAAPERIFHGEPAVPDEDPLHQLTGDAMYALVGHLFAEAHARVSVPMGPRVAAMVNAQVAKALGRLRIMPANEWEESTLRRGGWSSGG